MLICVHLWLNFRRTFDLRLNPERWHSLVDVLLNRGPAPRALWQLNFPSSRTLRPLPRAAHWIWPTHPPAPAPILPRPEETVRRPCLETRNSKLSVPTQSPVPAFQTRSFAKRGGLGGWRSPLSRDVPHYLDTKCTFFKCVFPSGRGRPPVPAQTSAYQLVPAQNADFLSALSSSPSSLAAERGPMSTRLCSGLLMLFFPRQRRSGGGTPTPDGSGSFSLVF